MCLEDRLFSDGPNETDKEWLAMLWELFEVAELSDLENAGLSLNDARKLAGLLALHYRYNKPHDD